MKLELNNDLANAFPNQKTSLYDTVQSGLILRVTDKGTKSFCFRYDYNGQKRRYTFGHFPQMSVSQARVKVEKFKDQLLDGIDPQGKRDQRKKGVSFDELAEEFIKKYLTNLRDSTKDKYTRIIENELLPHLADKKLNQITKGTLLKILDKKAYEEGHPTTANFIRKRLFTMFKFALQRDLVKHNVVESIPPYKSTNGSRTRYYSEEEIQMIWEVFGSLPKPTDSLFKILLLTAQRKNETRLMEFSHVDFQNKIWTIPASNAKNGNEHKVPLTDTALKLIKKLNLNNSKFVFQTRYRNCSNEPEPIQKVDYSVRTVKKETGIKDFRLHDLRRTAVTYMAKLGVERTVAGKLLNHKGLSGDSSVTAIYDRYSYQKEKRGALQLWDNHLNLLVM